MGQAKDSGILDIDWNGISDLMNKEFGDTDKPYSEAAWRKPYQMAKKFHDSGVFKKYENDDSYFKELQIQKDEIRKERIKLQTANIERGRVDRSQTRQEMYYEYVGSVCDTLPLPEFNPLFKQSGKEINYLVGLADIHFGAKFKSINNEYSPEIAKERLEFLTGKLINLLTRTRDFSHELVSRRVSTYGNMCVEA